MSKRKFDSDSDLDDIPFSSSSPQSNPSPTKSPEIDPLDAFMAAIHSQIAGPVAENPVAKTRFEEEEETPVESFLRSKKDLGLTLASEAMRAGYGSDEEVHVAAKAVDAGLVEYDEEDSSVVVVDRRR